MTNSGAGKRERDVSQSPDAYDAVSGNDGVIASIDAGAQLNEFCTMPRQSGLPLANFGTKVYMTTIESGVIA